MPVLYDPSLPDKTIGRVPYGDTLRPGLWNDAYEKIDAALAHLAAGLILVVETESDLDAFPVGASLGAVSFAFVAETRAFWFYGPPDAGTGTVKPGSVKGDGSLETEPVEIGSPSGPVKVPPKDKPTTTPTDLPSAWQPIGPGPAFLWDETDKDGGPSVTFTADGRAPLEVRLSVELPEKAGGTKGGDKDEPGTADVAGLAEILEDGVPVASRPIGPGVRALDVTAIRTPDAGPHTYTSRITDGADEKGGEPAGLRRLLTVRRG